MGIENNMGEYAGWKLTYEEIGNVFTARKDEKVIREYQEGLSHLRKKIDDYEKRIQKKKFDKIKCFVASYNRTFPEATITSIKQYDGRYTEERVTVRATIKNHPDNFGLNTNSNSNTTQGLDTFVKDTPENRQIIEKIIELEKQIKQMIANLERFNPKDFKELAEDVRGTIGESYKV